MRIAARLNLSLALIIVLVWYALTLAVPQRNATQSNWTPPPSRKAKTLFAPKPHGGNNIFKGEAESWLADALEKSEAGAFMPINDKSVIAYVLQVGNYLVSHSVKPMKDLREGTCDKRQ